MLVTGAIAGRSATDFAKNSEFIEPPVDQIQKLTNKIKSLIKVEGKYLPGAILSEVRKKSYKYIGPIRNKEGIVDFLKLIKNTKERIANDMYLKSDSNLHHLTVGTL